MRNITGFTILVILVYCAHTVPAEEKSGDSYAVLFYPQFGFFYGQAEEIVYPAPEYKAEKLSQLLWNMKPVFYYGLSLEFSRVQPMTQWGFFAMLSLKNAIPGKSGIMEDRDWMSMQYAEVTHYSRHDNYTNQFFLFDLCAGASFPLNRILLLKPYITVSYMHFRFSGKQGYGIRGQYLGNVNYLDNYAPISISESPSYQSFDGWEKVINYDQEWLIVAPGISLAYYFLKYFCAELSFQISPLISCNDLDEHLVTHTQYRDYMYGGVFLEPEARASFSPVKWLTVSLEFSWRYINGTRGATYQRPYKSDVYTQKGEAGAGLSVFDTGLGLKITL